MRQLDRSSQLPLAAQPAAQSAALLYTANPNYLFFDAQFAYESLALPLTMLALYAAARRHQAQDGSRLGLTLVILAGLAAVIVTHHVTTYALTALLVVWALLASARPSDWRAAPHPRGLALLALLAGYAVDLAQTPVFQGAAVDVGGYEYKP